MHRSAAPPRIKTEGHEAVDEVVAWCDPVEHLLDGLRLSLADGEFGSGHQSTLPSAPAQ